MDQKHTAGGRRNERTGSVCVIVSAVLFGCMPLLARVAYGQGSNAFSVAFGRFLFGSLFLWAIVRFRMGGSVRVSKRELWEIGKFSVPYALMPILLYSSYDLIDSGLATTLHFTYPVAVVLLLAVFYKKRLDRAQALCTVLCMAGILLLYAPNGQISVKGILLAALSGVFYAVYIVILGNSPAKGISPFVLSFWLSLFSACEIGLIALCTGHLTFRIQPGGWCAEILLALLTSVCALVLFQKGMLLCGEVKASLLSTFEPLTGLVIGMAVFQETVTARQWAGVLFILLAVLLLVLAPARKEEKEK